MKKKKPEGFKFTFPHCFMYLRMSLLAWFIRDHLFGWHQRMLKENFNYITTLGANSHFYSRITLLLNEYWVWKYHLYGFWSQTYFWKFLSWGGGGRRKPYQTWAVTSLSLRIEAEWAEEQNQPGCILGRVGTRTRAIPQGSMVGDRHEDVSPEDWIKTWSLVLRMRQAGCLYHDKWQSQMQTLEFHFIKEEKARLNF